MFDIEGDSVLALFMFLTNVEGRFDCLYVFVRGYSVQSTSPSLTQFSVEIPLSITVNCPRPILSNLN